MSIAGIEKRIGIKQSGVWGTKVALGALCELLVLSASGMNNGDASGKDASRGRYHSTDGWLGEVNCTPGLEFNLRYDGCQEIMAGLMGACTVPALVATTALSYAWTMDLINDIEGLMYTLAENMKTYINEIPSFKITGFTLSGNTGEPIVLKVKGIGIEAFTESLVNTLATMNNLTARETENLIMFSQGTYLMNDRDGIALASPTHKVNINGFSLDYDRNLAGVTGSYVSSGAVPRDCVDEPTINGEPKAELTLKFPRHTSDTRLQDLGDDVRKKMTLSFTGKLIEGVTKRAFAIDLAHLQIINANPTDDNGIIKEDLKCLVHCPPAAPAGMTGLTQPFRLRGVNKQSTSPITAY
jgi:hypothetical protein